MKTRVRVITCMVSFAFLLAIPSALAQADKLIGVWKITEVKTRAIPNQKLEARTITNPQPSLFIITKKHYSWQMVHGEKPRLDLPADGGTDAQRLEVMSQFTSNGGTYEIKGSTMILHAMVAKMPIVMTPEFTISFEFRFEGDQLILTMQNAVPEWPEEIRLTRLE